MFLIFLDNNVLGYTYNNLALYSLFKVNKESNNPLNLSFKEVSDEFPIKKGYAVKSKQYVENLVTWYSNHGKDWYYWKYIVYNRDIIPKFSYSFMYKFHKTCYDMILRDLIEDLTDILASYSIPYEDGVGYERQGYYGGKPMSARAKHSQRFHESMRRKYNK